MIDKIMQDETEKSKKGSRKEINKINMG